MAYARASFGFLLGLLLFGKGLIYQPRGNYVAGSGFGRLGLVLNGLRSLARVQGLGTGVCSPMQMLRFVPDR